MSELRKAAEIALEAMVAGQLVRAGEILLAALAQPEPEPVTWRYDYTRLPQRQPLTDEDIKGIVDVGLQTWTLGESTYEFARAIEKAHGIGDK